MPLNWQSKACSLDCDLREFLALDAELLPFAEHLSKTEPLSKDSDLAEETPTSEVQILHFAEQAQCSLPDESGPRLIDGVWHKTDKAKVIGEFSIRVPWL